VGQGEESGIIRKWLNIRAGGFADAVLDMGYARKLSYLNYHMGVQKTWEFGGCGCWIFVWDSSWVRWLLLERRFKRAENNTLSAYD
jgi:hypothetical protein